MRVVMLSHSSGEAPMGGAERSLLQLIDDWMAADPSLEVTVIARAPAALLQDALDDRGVTHVTLPYSAWALPVIPDAGEDIFREARSNGAAILRIADIIREVGADLVLTNTIVAPWAAIASRIVGVPHVWFVREFGDLDHGLSFMLGRDATHLDVAAMAELVVANSQAVLRDYRAVLSPDRQLCYYPRIDVARVQQLASSSLDADDPVDDDRPLIIHVGRIAPSKGQDMLVGAATILAARGVPFRVAFVGGGTDDDVQALLSQIARASLESSITVLDARDNPFPLVASAAVGVSTARNEAFGRVTAEYMALGLPVVAVRSGGSIELVTDGTTGALVTRDDAGELAAVLERYLTDPALASAHGQAGSEAIARMLDPEASLELFRRMSEIARERKVVETSRIPAIMLEWLKLPVAVDGMLADWARQNDAAARLEADRREFERIEAARIDAALIELNRERNA